MSKRNHVEISRMSVGTGKFPRTDSISADKDFLMVARRPPTIPREPGYWQATLCSIGFHVLLFGALWIGAMHHDSGSALSNIQRQSFAPSKATAIAGSTASSTTLPAIKSAVKETTAGSPAVDASSARSEKKILPTIATAKPATRIVREEKKYTRQRQLATLIRNGKFVEKKKERDRQNSLASQQEQQKLTALAHQIRRKQEATRAETLAKKRAAELVTKMATATQRRKELVEERSIESLHQEEMRRITSGLAGNGGSGNS